MFGPLPARYRFAVLGVSMLACLGLALWAARSVALSFEGYVVGLFGGALLAFVLLHDFTRPAPEVPIDPA